MLPEARSEGRDPERETSFFFGMSSPEFDARIGARLRPAAWGRMKMMVVPVLTAVASAIVAALSH